jgi:hypothetical protein
MTKVPPWPRQLVAVVLMLVPAVFVVFLGAGCTGSVLGTPGGGTQTPGPTGGGPAGTGGSGGVSQPPPAPPPPVAGFVPAAATLRRLTRAQYLNSVRDLLGQDINVTVELEPDTSLSGFASIGAALTTVSATAAEKFEAAATAIAQQALDPARRGRVVGCAPRAALDEACAKTFVTSFGRRAWRRPLSAEEVARYTAIATQGGSMLGDFWQGLGYALAGLLQSPHFLYRVEIGTPGVVKGQRVFDGWELASRLSYMVWNSTPDDALLDAAQSGALTAPGGLRQQAERLLSAARGRTVVRNFFFELYRLDVLDDLEQSPANFPRATKTIGPAMREETLRLVEEVVLAGGGDVRGVFDAPFAFVDRELAGLYGLPAPAGADFVKTTLPAGGLRLGILGNASFLASNAHEATTSPTRRGKFVREVMLCHEIPAPPPNVDAALPPEPPGGAPRTMRERLAGHNAPGCITCHAKMDPLGLAFENFDALGAFRAQDGGLAIDPSGDLDGQRFGNPRELGAVLRAHPDVEACLVRGLYRYAVGHIETAGEEVLIQRVAAAMGGDRFRSALLGVIESDGFRVAADAP